MMNKAFKIAGLGLLSGAVIFSAASYAHMDERHDYDRDDCERHDHDKGSKWEQRGYHKMKRAMRHLDLTESQETEIKSILADAKESMKAMHQNMKESRQALRSLMHDSEYDEAAVQQAANEQANLMASKLVFMAQTKADIFNILTPEQQEKLTDKLAAKGHH